MPHINGETPPSGVREELSEALASGSAETLRSVAYRDVPGFPGYRAGDDGSVWSCWKGRGRKPCALSEEWRELKQAVVGSLGYRVVCLSRNGKHLNKYVHVLVLEAFVGPCPPGMECRHFPDRDPGNNKIENVSWATKSQNNQDKIVHGTDMRGEKHTGAKLTKANVLEARRRSAGGEILRVLAHDYGVSVGTMHSAIVGKTWGCV